MKRLIVGLLTLGSGLLLGTPACNETPVAPIKDGVAECESIGAACHAPGDEFGGRYQECHDIGHKGIGEDCLAAYDECFELCQAAPSGGAGGEGGGTGHGHGGESGHGGETAHGHGGESGHGHAGETAHGHGGEAGASAGHD